MLKFKNTRNVIKGLALSSVLAVALTSFLGTASASSFSDVPSTHWAAESIKQASEKGYLSGYPDGTFKPSANVSRAELIAILTRLLDIEANGQAFTFQDQDGKWSHAVIGGAVDAGIVKPSEYGKNFEPSNPSTRAEISRFMTRGLTLGNEEYSQAIVDTKDTLLPIPEYYGAGLNKADIPYVAVAMGTGLLNGYEDDTFRPNGNTTRAEVAALITRYLNVLEKDPTSFRDLEELRAVGVEGTNFHVVVENGMVGKDFSGKVSSFNDVRNKKHTFTRNNVGYTKLNRLIFFGGQTKDEMDSIYTKMFYDETMFTHENIVPFVVEKSFTALKEYDKHFFGRYTNGSPTMSLIIGDPMYGENVGKYSLIVRPREETTKYMESINGQNFWEYGNYNLPSSHSSYITDDGSRYSIRIDK